MKSLIVFCLASASVMAQASGKSTDPDQLLIQKTDSLIGMFKFAEAFSTIAQSDTSRVEVLLRMGLCQAKLGATVEAIRVYEKVLRKDSLSLTSLNQLGLLYSNSGEYVNAITCFEKLATLDPANAYYCNQAGRIAESRNDVVSAVSWYRKSIVLNPRGVESYMGLANVLYEASNYNESEAMAIEGLSVNPYFKPLTHTLAKVYFTQDRYEEVIEAMEQLQPLDTTLQDARMLALSYFHTQAYAKSIPFLKYLVTQMYHQDWVFYYLGLSLRELGKTDAAIGWLELAAKKSLSKNTKIYFQQLALTHERNDDYESAIRAYRSAYNYSKDGIILYHLARSYDLYYKDKSTAILYYQKYLESDDTTRVAKEYARRRIHDMGIF